MSAVAGPLPTKRPHTVSVSEGYERWAPIYDDSPNPLLAREERYLAPLLDGLTGRNVLDLACGTGRWLEKLAAEKPALAIGIDSSSAMLRVAAKKCAIAGRLTQADVVRLPFQSNAFDLIICSFAIAHIADLPALVRELKRVGKPGADLFVSDLHPEAYARGFRTGFRDVDGAAQIEMLPRTPDEISQAFSFEGFESVRQVSLALSDPEKPIFVRAGKADWFEAACEFPTVLVCHFKRRS